MERNFQRILKYYVFSLVLSFVITESVPLTFATQRTGPEDRDPVSYPWFRYNREAEGELNVLFQNRPHCPSGTTIQSASVECFNEVFTLAAQESQQANQELIRNAPDSLRQDFETHCISGMRSNQTEQAALCLVARVHAYNQSLNRDNDPRTQEILTSRCGTNLVCTRQTLSQLRQQAAAAELSANTSLGAIRAIGILGMRCNQKEQSQPASSQSRCLFSRTGDWNTRVFNQTSWDNLPYRTPFRDGLRGVNDPRSGRMGLRQASSASGSGAANGEGSGANAATRSGQRSQSVVARPAAGAAAPSAAASSPPVSSPPQSGAVRGAASGMATGVPADQQPTQASLAGTAASSRRATALDRAFQELVGQGATSNSGLSCPNYIPTPTCREGRFDVSRFAPQTHDAYSSGPGESTSRLIDTMYGVAAPQFEQEAQSFLLDRFAETFLQEQALRGRLDPRLIDTIANACPSAPSFRNRVRALYNEVHEIPVRASELMRYETDLAASSQCLAHMMPRWQHLRTILGFDQSSVATQHTPGLLEEAAENVVGMLPLMPAFSYMMNHTPVAAFERGARQECSFQNRTTNAGVAVTVTNSDGTQSQMPRARYCEAIALEFAMLSNETASILSSRPLLGTTQNGRTVYETIAAAGPIPDRISRYSMSAFRDFRADPDRSPADGSLPSHRSCLGLMERRSAPTAQQVTSNSIPEPTLEIPAPAGMQRHPSIDAANRIVQQRRGQNFNDETTSQALVIERIRQICNNGHNSVAEMLQNSNLTSEFYSCSSRNFSLLRRNAGQARDVGTHRLSTQACRDRMSSNWIACRMFQTNERSQRDMEAVSNIAELGMALMGTEGTISLPFPHQFSRFSRGGALMGIGFTLPSLATMGGERDAALGSATDYLAGVGNRDSYLDAMNTLRRWSESDPRVHAIVSAAITGGFTAGESPLGEVHPGEERALAQFRRNRELDLMNQIYGGLANARLLNENPSAHASMVRVLDGAIREAGINNVIRGGRGGAEVLTDDVLNRLSDETRLSLAREALARRRNQSAEAPSLARSGAGAEGHPYRSAASNGDEPSAPRSETARGERAQAQRESQLPETISNEEAQAARQQQAARQDLVRQIYSDDYVNQIAGGNTQTREALVEMRNSLGRQAEENPRLRNALGRLASLLHQFPGRVTEILADLRGRLSACGSGGAAAVSGETRSTLRRPTQRRGRLAPSH